MRKLYYFVKSLFIRLELVQDWQDDLIMCPSQCYYYFKHKGKDYCIYLRWRWSDPWAANLISDVNPNEDYWDPEQWTELYISSFTHDELPLLKQQAIKEVKFLLSGYYE